jgi:membrane protease YdiL (CAAX protease family)
MNKKKTFLKIYFWVMLVLITPFALKSFTFSPVDIAQIFFTYLGFIALFGYAYDKRIFNQLFWKVSIIPYFGWEIGCYIFITGFSMGSIIVLLTLLPKYWSLVCYTYLTHETDDEKKAEFGRKMDKIFDFLLPLTRKEPVD